MGNYNYGVVYDAPVELFNVMIDVLYSMGFSVVEEESPWSINGEGYIALLESTADTNEAKRILEQEYPRFMYGVDAGR